MPHPSKRKGHVYERELVEKLERAGYKAERAWGSNGAAFGEHEEVDVRFDHPNSKRPKQWLVQAKRRKSIPSYIRPSDDVDMVILREDRGKDLAVVPLYLLLDLIHKSTLG